MPGAAKGIKKIGSAINLTGFVKSKKKERENA